MNDVLKVPPHRIEAEQSVIGGLLLDNDGWLRIEGEVCAEDFYRGDHQLIFEYQAKLLNAGKPCDVITLSELLEENGKLDLVGGLAYLGALAKNTPSAANIKAYAEIVREKSVLRQMVRVGTDIANSAFETDGRSTAELLHVAEQDVLDIAKQSNSAEQSSTLHDVLVKVIDDIDAKFMGESEVGIKTGFNDLDEQILGLEPGDLVVLAGRPAMGKTSLAFNIAENICVYKDLPGVAFSMEMPKQQIVRRMVSSLGKIDNKRVRTGKLENDDWPKLTSAASLMADKRFEIDDTPALTIHELRNRARRIKHKYGDLALIVVDYIQLMSISSKENRAVGIGEVTQGLKVMAKELGVPVIALSQLNRALENRPNKRPQMSDLRESGSVEQDADLILFVYRDEVYNEDSEDKGIAEIIIGKQRNGPIGTVRVASQLQYSRFENLAYDDFAAV